MIAYSQCWEDASLMIKALQIKENDIVVSITSGACNTLSIAEVNPLLIYSVDNNLTQNYLLELKIAAIRNLNSDEAIAFLGYRRCRKRYAIYESLLPHLSINCRVFWDNNSSFIKKGIVHCGKFERYLHVFRNFILPLIHTKNTLNELVKPKSKSEQERFYSEKWDSLRWKLLFKVFFSKSVMSGRGRSKQMFAHSKNKSISSIYSARVKQALTNTIVHHNFYLNYILFNTFLELPLYLENIEMCTRNSFKQIKIINLDLYRFLKSMPDNSISKFNLSDVFEPLSQNDANVIFNEIYRVAKPDARIIFWNNLVIRDIPSFMSHLYIRNSDLETELCKNDKIFFYEGLYIYTIRK